MANPGITTLAAITAAAVSRADQVNPGFLTAAEWTNNVNASIQELYGLLLQKYGNDYFVKLPPATITFDGVNDYFALPGDFLKLLGVDLIMSNSPNGYISLRQFMFSERNRYSLPNVQSFYGVSNLQYRLLSGQQQGGDQIWFIPRPTANAQARIWYVPRFTPLVNGTDTWDGFNGWEEYVVLDAAMKAMQKEESDTSALRADKAAMIERIEAEAENRNAGEPQRAPDPNADGGYYGGWWGSGGPG